MIWLANWRAIWSYYRAGLPVGPLRFRRGFTLYHGSGDDPIAHLHEVFADRCYRRFIDGELTGVMVDLGANIGAVTLDWASRSPRLRIHAYEPYPKANEILRHNIETNGLAHRVSVYGDAVGPSIGEMTLWNPMTSVHVTGYGECPSSAQRTRVVVPMVDLNEVIRRVDGEPITLLKIDTEGAEADILEGASPSTLRVIGQIILEYHNQLCPGAFSRCRKVLDLAGFACRVRPANADGGLLYAWRNSM